jgi:Flp pilus assembly protein TadD
MIALSAALSACTQMPQAQVPQTGEAGVARYSGQPDAVQSQRAELMYELLRAEMSARRGEVDGALDAYMKASAQSDDPEVAERAARLALYANDWNQAAVAAERWLTLAPGSVPAHQILLGAQLRRGEVDAAVDAFDRLQALSGQDREQAMQGMTAQLMREEDSAYALAVAAELARRYPDSAAAQLAHARLALEADQRGIALEAADRALALAPNLGEAALLRARALAGLGRSDEAFAGLDAAIQRAPDDLSLRLGHARLLVENGRFDSAEQAFADTHALAPKRADVTFSLALLALEARRLAAAETYLDKLLELGQQTDEAHYYLGRIHDSRRQFDEAIGHYLQVGKGQYQLDAAVRRAELLAQSGDLDGGRALLSELRLRYPEDEQQLRFVLAEGRMLRESGAHAEAYEVFSGGLERFPADAELLYARALAADKLGRGDRFEADLQAIIEREPDNGHALNALGYWLADRGVRLDEAERYLRRAIELLPDDPAVIDSMGWLRFRQGQMQPAEDLLRRAYGLYEDPEIAAHLGQVLWSTGRREEARALWQSALEQAPEDAALQDLLDRHQP